MRSLAQPSLVPNRTVKLPVTLVVAHEPLIALGLRTYLLSILRVPACLTSADLAQVALQLEDTGVELIIICRSHMTEDCIRAVHELRHRRPPLGVIMMPHAPSPHLVWRIIDAGARGIVTMDEPLEELDRAIETVQSGGVHVSPLAFGSFQLAMHGDEESGETERLLRSLSSREMEIFELIGRGRCNKEIASHLHISPKTLDTYKARIKSKLLCEHTTELAKAATRHVLRSQPTAKSSRQISL